MRIEQSTVPTPPPDPALRTSTGKKDETVQHFTERRRRRRRRNRGGGRRRDDAPEPEGRVRGGDPEVVDVPDPVAIAQAQLFLLRRRR